MKLFYLTTAAFFALPAVAQAQTATPAPVRAPAPAASGDIIVTGVIRQTERDVLQGTSVLSGEELTRELRPSIGETLARLPGVSATSFGPAASRPILRGFQGDRIRLLTDGIGSFDASTTSVDHAPVINPLLAERIEVLRGPVALLYGSSAVGGVVNVVDTRIPRRLPDGGAKLTAVGTLGSAADERSISASGDVTATGPLVLHVDGSYLKTGDLRTGGYILSREARATALANAAAATDPAEAAELRDVANLRGRLPNSAIETKTFGAGAAIVQENGSLGVSYSRYESRYGVPIRYALEAGGEQEAPRIDIAQDRYDLRAEINPTDGFFDAIRARAGYADYRHFELEPDGGIGTAFYNNGMEGRVEFSQRDRGGWRGASGAQYLYRNLEVVGDEAFVPPTTTQQIGLFTLQQFHAGAFRAEGGVRYERSSAQSRALPTDMRYPRGTRVFDTVSGSLGASYDLATDFRLGLNLSRTERAPTAEELYANGPHAGTQAYELGGPNFRVEKSWGAEATLHAHAAGLDLDASAFYNRFTNYIYDTQVDQSVCDAAAGEVTDLPCFQFRQADADYWGMEASASLALGEVAGHRLNADLIGDYVHATIRDIGPVPRIPPLRLLAGLEAQGDRTGARVEVEQVFAQNRVSENETRTPGYTLLNTTLTFKPFPVEDRLRLQLSANNLLDVTARRHASVLKDFAPLAGRDIRLTATLAL